MVDFLAGIGLVFVIEGLLFAAFPRFVLGRMADAMRLGEGRLRAVGLVSAVIGVTIVWVVRRHIA
jgi:uncharacterized protein YjeT (DUF2065 family)